MTYLSKEMYNQAVSMSTQLAYGEDVPQSPPERDYVCAGRVFKRPWCFLPCGRQ
jgi:hypothetical protein